MADECVTCNGTLEEGFCCFVIVPGDAEAVPDNVNGIIVKKCLECCEGTIEKEATVTITECPALTTIDCPIKLKTFEIVGCVKVQASMQIKDKDDSTKTTRVCCRDCVCFEKTGEPVCICCPDCCCPGCSCDDVEFDVSVEFDDAVPITNSGTQCPNGNRVYKLTGTVTVTITCPSSCHGK